MESQQQAITGILNYYGAKLSADLKNDIQTKRITKYGVANASGKLKDSIRQEVEDNVLRIYALDYIFYVENGRANGKRPPTKAIEQWITDKGLILEGISKKSLAYLIARKIGEEGTTAFKQGGTNLTKDILTTDLKGEIQSKLILTFRENTNAMMRNALTIKK